MRFCGKPSDSRHGHNTSKTQRIAKLWAASNTGHLCQSWQYATSLSSITCDMLLLLSRQNCAAKQQCMQFHICVYTTCLTSSAACTIYDGFLLACCSWYTEQCNACTQDHVPSAQQVIFAGLHLHRRGAGYAHVFCRH